MGFFDKLFDKKDKNVSNNQPVKPAYKPDWDFYFSNVDDVISSFFIDLGLIDIAPVFHKPNLVWISLQMNNPREDGLSSREEFETLKMIEDRLKEFVLANDNAIYAGRFTTKSRRDFYFYFAGNTLYDKTITDAMVAFPAYSYDFGIKEDILWEQYTDFMYPNPQQLQCLMNRRVLDNLQRNGDALTKPRPVHHWIYFKNDSDRSLFLQKIQHLQFDIENKDKIESTGKYPFRLVISRVDHVNQDSVDEYVLQLWNIANESNGDYDGWETLVVKD